MEIVITQVERRLSRADAADGPAQLLHDGQGERRGSRLIMGDDDVDGLIGELTKAVRLPIVLEARGGDGVQAPLEVAVGHGPDGIGDRRADPAERGHDSLTLGEVTGVGEHQDQDGLTVVGRVHEGGVGGQLVRGLAAEVAVGPQDIAGDRQGVDEQARQDRADRVESVFEGGDDPEVPAPAAQAPEQVGILLGTRRQHPAIGRHDVGGDEVVAGQAVLPHQPPQAAAERQAGDAGRGDEPAGRRQAERLGLAVELAVGHPGLGPHGAAGRVHADALQPTQVDDQAAVTQRLAGDVMAAAPDGGQEVVRAAEFHRPEDVGDPGAADDEAGVLIHHRVIEPACGVIAVRTPAE